MSKETKKVEAAMEKKTAFISRKDYLSCGSTLLNLCCSNKYYGAFVKGKYYFFVGDSSSGKTWLALTCLAEASINPSFDDYRLIHDNVEDGALMDMEKYFGKKVAERIESPSMDKEGTPIYSSTVEEFYFHVSDACEAGKPFIYILDSMDSLSSEDELEKFAADKKAIREDKEVKGSYGDGKAKKNSAYIRQLLPMLKRSGSILIIISQTRDNLGFTVGPDKKTRSGGKALRFYATLEMWTSIVGKIKKNVKGVDRQIGITSKVQIKKNRMTGKERTIEIPIFHSYGIDDIGSCVDYLVAEKHWTKKKASIVAPEFEFEGTKAGLIQHIEENKLEKKLKILVSEVWEEIEAACSLQRKARYA